MKKTTTSTEFSSDNISERISDLFKKINISQFAEEHGLARKTLYKMKDKGVIPRGIFLLLCEEAGVNPILVRYSISERLFYFSCLSEYIRDSTIDELYSEHIELAKKNKDPILLSSLSLVHNMMLSGDITTLIYEQRVREILKKT